MRIVKPRRRNGQQLMRRTTEDEESEELKGWRFVGGRKAPLKKEPSLKRLRMLK